MRWGLGSLAAAVWCLAAVLPARCEDQPVLMLDTGHLGKINGITFTADGGYVVSGASDKLVRVWDWRTGKTVRTIRGQVGLGYEGRISAMAQRASPASPPKY